MNWWDIFLRDYQLLVRTFCLNLIFIMTDKKHTPDTGNTGKGKDQPGERTELMTSSLLDLSDYPHKALFSETAFPWQALPRVPAYLDKLINQVPSSQRNRGTSIGSVHIDSNVLIGSGTVLEHGAMVKGPAIIGENCQLRKGAYIRGNVLIGNGCTIGNSSEIKHSIIFDQAEISHFNYVGDSIVAKRAHMAAGAITSNLKLDSTPVTVSLNSGNSIKTQLIKFGAVLGEHCQIGCNVVLNPGSVIGKQSIVYPCVSFRGYLPANRVCKLQQGRAVVPRL